jgi:hypothetical protein
MFAKYREIQMQERQAGDALPLLPTCNRRHYGILLSGHPMDQKKGIQEIPLEQEVGPMDVQIVAEESEHVAVLMEYNGGNCDRASKSLRDIEALKIPLGYRSKEGYNGRAF